MSTLAAPSAPPVAEPLRLRGVFAAWWPLAASWLLMGLELPLVSAVMARLRDPVTSLAAYGGVVFPISMMIEAPIMMLLTASTALSRDRASYRLVRRFMFAAGGSLSALHALIAFTPLFDLVVGGVLHAPAEIREPARLGMRLMVPWTASIAYRRFQQGALIRFGRSRAVGVGTAVRLGTDAGVLALGALLTRWPGIAVGCTAVASGVIAEATYAAWAARPVVRGPLRTAPIVSPPLALPQFGRFYLPLALTPLLTLIAMPLASAAMSRMPRPIESLAAWPVVNGLVFTLRSTGFALSEVVVSQLDRPRALPVLRRFTILLAIAVTVPMVLAAATPLGTLWFARVSALAPALVALAAPAIWLSLAMPASSAIQSGYQGVVVHGHRTRTVTESMAVYLAVVAVILGAGVAAGRWPGLWVASAAMTIGALAQAGWLAARAGPALEALRRQPG